MADGRTTRRVDARTLSQGPHEDARTGEPLHTMSGASKQGRETILVLNHQRSEMRGVVTILEQHGLVVQVSTGIPETYKLLAEVRPDVVVLDPLVLRAGCLELELVEGLQRERDPVPAIVLVDDLDAVENAHLLAAPFRDFVRRALAEEEVPHRVRLALVQRRKFLSLLERTRELEGQVSIDFKTGLLSERHFKKILQVEHKRAQRHGHPLSLLLVDIDDFKSVNDSTEYAFGDEVLRTVAAALRSTTRETDFAARYGGDEFMVLLPHTRPAEAVQTAARIRRAIANMVVSNGAYVRRVTVSIGIDTYDGRSHSTADDLRRRANKALHEAKQRGKNQVWLYSEGERPSAPAEAAREV